MRGGNKVRAWEALYPGVYRTNLNALEFFSDPLVLQSRQRVIDNISSSFPSVPIEELTAVHHYTTNAYKQLNSALRGGSPSNYYQGFEEMVNNGLRKLPIYSGDVYRGTTLDIDLVLTKYKAAKDNGVPVTELHFSSTSKDLNVAEGFLDDVVDNLSTTLNTSTPDKKVKVMFYYSGGARDVENVSFYGPNGPGYNELEALFESNTKFDVVNFKDDLIDSDGNVIVEIFMSKTD